MIYDNQDLFFKVYCNTNRETQEFVSLLDSCITTLKMLNIPFRIGIDDDNWYGIDCTCFLEFKNKDGKYTTLCCFVNSINYLAKFQIHEGRNMKTEYTVSNFINGIKRFYELILQ